MFFGSSFGRKETRISYPEIDYNNNNSLVEFQQLLLTRLQQCEENHKFSWSIYENVPDLTKLWILQDQKRLNNINYNNIEQNITNNSNIESCNLQKLPIDVKFNIIDFIPTFSLKNEFKNDNVSKMEIFSFFNPNEITKKLKFEMCYSKDTKFRTFHKMRLINREYAKRMKIKILETEELDLTNMEITKNVLLYLCCFISEQNNSSQNHDDNIFIYSNINNTIDLMKPNEIPKPAITFPFGVSSTIFGQTFFEGSAISTSLPIIDEPKTTIEEMLKLSDEELAIEIEKRNVKKIKPHFHSNVSNYRPVNVTDSNTKTFREKLYKSLIPLELSSLIPEDDSTTSYYNSGGFNDNYGNISFYNIGTNQRLKRVSINMLTSNIVIALKNCENLKVLEITEPVISRDFTQIIGVVLNSVEKLIISERRVFQSLKSTFNDNVVVEIMPKNSVKELYDNLLQYDNYRNNESLFDLSEFTIPQQKECIDYFRDCNISIRNVLRSIEFNNVPEEILSYAIYTCNTYQEGYFISQHSDVRKSLHYGWLPNSIELIGELVKHVDWKSAIMLLDHLKTRIIRKEFILLLRHLLILYAFNPNQFAIYSIYCYIKENVTMDERRIIIGPVTCKIPKNLVEKIGDVKQVTIPFISLNFQNYQFAMELIDEMTPEELEQQNELGDTCLHFQLDYCNEIIEKIIEKQPKLTKILNNQQRNILHMLSSNSKHQRYALVLKLLTKYEMDYQQQDITNICPLHSENNVPLYIFEPETRVLLNVENKQFF